MTVEPIGAASVAVYLTLSDLSLRGFTPASLTLEQALELTREACGRVGVALDGAVEIEAYPEYCGVLVFAHAHPEGPAWFVFDELEQLLRAALALHNMPVDAALWWRDGRYWLSLPPEAEAAAAVCREFGSPRQAPEEGLEKAGKALYPHYALWELCFHFLRLHL